MFKDERLDTSLLMFFYYAIELSYPYNLSVDLKIVKAGKIAPPFLFLYRWRLEFLTQAEWVGFLLVKLTMNVVIAPQLNI